METFLKVVIPEGGELTVMVVLRMPRVGSGIAMVNPGQGFGFLGEVKGGQLPPLVKLLEAIVLLRQALAPNEILALIWADWNTSLVSTRVRN